MNSSSSGSARVDQREQQPQAAERPAERPSVRSTAPQRRERVGREQHDRRPAAPPPARPEPSTAARAPAPTPDRRADQQRHRPSTGSSRARRSAAHGAVARRHEVGQPCRRNHCSASPQSASTGSDRQAVRAARGPGRRRAAICATSASTESKRDHAAQPLDEGRPPPRRRTARGRCGPARRPPTRRSRSPSKVGLVPTLIAAGQQLARCREAPQPAGVHAVGGRGDHARRSARWRSGSRARGRAGRPGRPRRARRTGGPAPRRRPRRRRRPGRCRTYVEDHTCGPPSSAIPSAVEAVRRARARAACRRRRRPWCRTGSWRRPRRPRACSASTRTPSTNSSGRPGGHLPVERHDQHVRRPRPPASSAARLSSVVSVGGACSGRSTAIGCGSKVTATTRQVASSSATSRARASDVLVPEVDAVEVADRDDGAAEVGGHLVQRAPDLHGGLLLSDPGR